MFRTIDSKTPYISPYFHEFTAVPLNPVFNGAECYSDDPDMNGVRTNFFILYGNALVISATQRGGTDRVRDQH